jgi:hypothetical protein
LLDAILTLRETTSENETRRRIKAINAITAYCGVEEGLTPRRNQDIRSVKDSSPLLVQNREAEALSEAIQSIRGDKRPTSPSQEPT